MSNISLSLYLHIPFCKHRCAYCDFNTYTSLLDLRETYADALVAEMAQVAGGVRRPVHTIFFGGGTPSLMSPASMQRILDGVRANFDLAADAEVTMEANPGTVDLDYLTAVSQTGINRLSFGVQSVIPSELALLERTHDFGTVVEAVQMARQAGLNNFNLDLIYGVPGQTLNSWEQSVRTVLDLDPTHLSLYCLTIEPGTPMQRWLLNGRIQPPDPDLAADQYELACTILVEHGYDHYEISNWGQTGQGMRAQSNLLAQRRLFGAGRGGARPRRRDALPDCEAAARLSASVGRSCCTGLSTVNGRCRQPCRQPRRSDFRRDDDPIASAQRGTRFGGVRG